MGKEKIEYSLQMDAQNIIKYQTYDLKDDAYLYNCVICGASTCISGSLNYRGHRLICNHCIQTRFDSVTKAFMWVAE